jgi:peptidyl-prolyl cis-trans isomerase B (cyclophilin B)
LQSSQGDLKSYQIGKQSKKTYSIWYYFYPAQFKTMKSLILSFFCLIMPVVFTNAQTSEPTPVPPAKKTNSRPAETAPKEPFDNAGVEKMHDQCVRLETEAGIIELEMFPENAPETVRNFLNLVSIKAFDTTLFSRVVPDFVIQGGNVSTRLQKTPELMERARRGVRDEPSLVKHERGILSLARSDEPNSGTSHFFILVREAPNLDGKFAAFGKVTKGMEIVDAINKMPVEGEKPLKPVRLTKASLIPCAPKTEAPSN